MPTGGGAAIGRPVSVHAHRSLAYQSIVAAALDLLGEQGLSGVTMAAVQGRAGRSAADFDAHFAHRADLLDAMAEAVAARAAVVMPKSPPA